MRNYYLTVAVLAAMILVSCRKIEKENENGPDTDVPVESVTLNPDRLELKVGEVYTLVAEISPDNATDKSVVWKSSDETLLSVDAGGRVTALAAGSAEVTVTTVSGGKTACCNVTIVQEQDDRVKMINTTKVLYYGDRKTKGVYNYYLGLGDSEFIKDEQGDDAAAEGGMIVFMDIYSSTGSDSFETAKLPEGRYVIAEGKEPGTMDNYYTRQQINVDGKQKSVDFSSGELNVTHTAGGYLLEGSFVFKDSGETLDFYYEGSLEFGDPDAGSGDGVGDIPEDLDLSLISASGVYMGDQFGSGVDEYLLSFADVKIGDDGIVTAEGYNLIVDLMAKASDYILIPEGTYVVNDTYNSGTAVTGEMLFGYSGTYCAKVSDEGQLLQIAMIKSGTVNVKETDMGYLFEFDLVTASGVSIKGTYDGYIDIEDKSSGGEEGPFSTLTGDYVTDFSDAESSVNYYGDYFGVGMDNWLLELYGSKDGIGIEFLTEPGQGKTRIPQGRYNMSVEDGVGFVKGTYNSGMLGTWWIDMTTVVDGVAKGYAPAIEGWVEISKDGELDVVRFEFVDDLWNLFSGEWKGKLPDAADMSMNAPARSRLIRNQH